MYHDRSPSPPGSVYFEARAHTSPGFQHHQQSYLLNYNYQGSPTDNMDYSFTQTQSPSLSVSTSTYWPQQSTIEEVAHNSVTTTGDYGSDMWSNYTAQGVSTYSPHGTQVTVYPAQWAQDNSHNTGWDMNSQAPDQGSPQLEGDSGGQQQTNGSPTANVGRNAERNFMCQVPGCTSRANFTRQADLLRHETTVHGSDKPFPCSVNRCTRVGDRAFTRKDHLNEHMRQYHGQEIPKRRGIKYKGPNA